MSPDSLSSQELTDVIAQDTSAEGDSLSETIAAAVKASEEVEKPAEAPSDADDVTDDEQDSEETLEGADSKEEETADSEEPGDDATDQTEEGEDDPAVEAKAEPVIDPPARFSEKDKETFRSLPREAQEILAARNQEMEADYTRKTTEIAEQRKATEAINAAVEPYRPYLASLSISPERAFSTLLGADYQLRNGTPEQKVKFAVQLVRDYGINLADISEQSEDDAVAPEIAQVNQRISGIERVIQSSQTQAQTQLTQNAEAQVTVFAEEKDDAGDLVHPHFAEVRAVMGALVSANPELDVQTAYENAVWANPQLREADLAKQRQEADKATEQRRAEATKTAEQEKRVKAKKAKKAANGVKGTAEPPGPGVETAEVSLRGEIERNMAASSP